MASPASAATSRRSLEIGGGVVAPAHRGARLGVRPAAAHRKHGKARPRQVERQRPAGGRRQIGDSEGDGQAGHGQPGSPSTSKRMVSTKCVWKVRRKPSYFARQQRQVALADGVEKGTRPLRREVEGAPFGGIEVAHAGCRPGAAGAAIGADPHHRRLPAQRKKPMPSARRPQMPQVEK